MLLTKKFEIGLSALTIALVVAIATSAFAENRKETRSVQSQVADQLAEFRRTAAQMSREADTLDSHVPGRLSWETHSQHLETLRNHVNQLGKNLTDLETLKPQASESQQMAIEHLRPHLVAVADNVTEALDLIRESRGNIRFPDYGEAVSNIYEHADALHAKLDAILDHEDAKTRLDDLGLQPSLNEAE